MEGKASIEALRRLTLHTEVEVVTQQLLVVGVYALLDDLLSTLAGALATEVSDTVLGDDIFTECSLWSRCETIGTKAEILPSLAVEGVVKIER